MVKEAKETVTKINSPKKRKALLISSVFILSLLVISSSTVLWFFMNSFLYHVKAPSTKETISSDKINSFIHQGHEKKNYRGLYDKTGNRIQLRGINAGNILLQEGWMSPFAVNPKKNEDGTIAKDKDNNVLYPEFTEEDFRIGLSSNENLKNKQNEMMDYYYKSFFSEEDFRIVKDELKFNCIRLPFYWRNLLNEERGNFYRKPEKEAFNYLDWFISEARKNNLYVILDLHGAPYSQNGYEHSGLIPENNEDPGFWSSKEAMDAVVDLWNYVSEHYAKPENKILSESIASYDLLNEPQMKKDTPEPKECFDYQDKIYKSLRERNDQHLITIECMWDPSVSPNPSTYNWENIMYEYHYYNWGNVPLAAYKAYFDMRAIGKDYDVPIYIGEFTCFEDTKIWKDTLVDWFDERFYNWTIWNYKTISQGWWTSSWGVYTATLNLNIKNEELKCNVSTCTEEEFKLACEKIKTEKCITGTLKKVIDAYNTSSWEKIIK